MANTTVSTSVHACVRRGRLELFKKNSMLMTRNVVVSDEAARQTDGFTEETFGFVSQ